MFTLNTLRLRRRPLRHAVFRRHPLHPLLLRFFQEDDDSHHAITQKFTPQAGTRVNTLRSSASVLADGQRNAEFPEMSTPVQKPTP